MVGRNEGTPPGSSESEMPERLRREVRDALRRCGVNRSEWLEHDLDIHHVVAAGLAGAADGRRTLERWRVSVQCVENAAIVPRPFHQGQGLHRQAFLRIVNQRLAAADLFAAALVEHSGFVAGRLIILQTIQKIGTELVLRSGDVVAIRLQAALQSALPRPPGSGGGGAMLSDRRERATRSALERRRAPGEGADGGDASFRGPQRHSVHVASSQS